MNFEAIETAFELLLENVQTIENDLGTHAYDALIEQNSYYLGAEVANEPVSYTHLRAHETRHDLVCRLLLEKKKPTILGMISYDLFCLKKKKKLHIKTTQIMCEQCEQY